MDFLRELNEQQRLAATAGDGPVMIVAGPGTGKTKTLTARLAYLLAKGVPVNEIVALTFTNKAARDMRERLVELLGPNRTLPKVTTFHALGYELLNGRVGDSRLIAEDQRTAIIKSLSKPTAFKGMTARELGLVISRAKTELAEFDDAAPALLSMYNDALATQNWLDFDDLLRKTYDLLQGQPAARPQFQYVLVDEFQDTSGLQYELLSLLSNTKNVFVIGDPNQSIYAFRGAGGEMFDRFRANFPTALQVALTINYRSSPEIVALANAIFPDSPALKAQRAEPGQVRALQTLNELSEAQHVIAVIEQGIGGSDFLHAHATAEPHEPRNYAVLYRTHRAAKALQAAFADAGVPFQIAGEGSPYERPAVRSLIQALRFLHEPENTALPAFRNLKPTGVHALLAEISADDTTTVCEQAETIARKFNLQNDPGLPQLLSMLVQFGAGSSGVAQALTYLDQMSENEFYDPSVNAVTLMTIHASKGLEFEHVFVIAAEDGVLPKLRKTGHNNPSEERRLFYVAATRARRQLDIVYAKSRGHEPAQPSRFISELDPQTLPRAVDPGMAKLEKRAARKAQKRAQASLF